MALTYKQSVLVRGSIPALREHGETIATLFYSNMLRGHPELKVLFNTANQATGRQPRALTSVILAFAANLHHTSELIPRLERVCNKHCSLGIHPEHYDVVGKYLLQAFAQVLGPAAWTPDLHAAWSRAYSVLARMLSGREAQLYRQFAADTATPHASTAHDPDAAAWTGWRPFTVDKRVDEAAGMVSFYLYPVDGRRLPLFRPGQYVSLRVQVPELDNQPQLRQYALSEAPRPEYYRITVKRDMGRLAAAAAAARGGSSAAAGGAGGKGGARASSIVNSGARGGDVRKFRPGVVSNLLLDEKWPGDAVELSHPAGDFWVDEDALEAGRSLPLVLLSAGIGAAPLMAMFNGSVTAVSPVPSRAGTPSSGGASVRERPISWVHWSAPSSSSSSPSSSSGLASPGGRRGTDGTDGTAPFQEHVRRVARERTQTAAHFFRSRVAEMDDLEAGKEETERELMALRMDLASLAEAPGRPLHLDHGAALYYVCGTEAFMEEAGRFLAERRVDRARVKFEWFTTGDPAEKVVV
ncbi:hypothetical protein SODALDRAFT_331750 [Sodiomyces alkalinus F11]|uniref:nitric oxide dioxygenase n=1 Tax=Sodiomyces alkalinus (strain CBS 110278 / VKM F-3762 / F11) TaxID=1314773 RepID=A0A3N2PYN0_SODAK|nr:hypothetical protein SODALDRAFT_331750 [Sodiomyces alkalinus F11]ROT39641.1 hypothetical protein SODALDRAFT_331750 [Sodiomyces alkalinus F11]